MKGSQSTSASDDLRTDPSFISWKRSWPVLQIVEVCGPIIIDDLRYGRCISFNCILFKSHVPFADM